MVRTVFERLARECLAYNGRATAVDMYAAQTGTAQDVSLIIDFLPAILFPQGRLQVERWICMGVYALELLSSYSRNSDAIT